MQPNSILNILLVDDDEDDYLLTKMMLNKMRGKTAHLEWVSTFDEGQKALESGCYDIVLMDYDLGTGNGMDLIREAVVNGCSVPFILLTGHGSYEVDVEAMQAGATLYLTKAEVNTLLLERSIRYAIDHKQTKDALKEANEDLKKELKMREQAEDALRRSEAKIRAVFRSLVEGVVFLNTQGEVEEANVAAQLSFGNSLEKLSVTDLDLRAQMIRPDGELFPVEEQPAIVALRTGEAVRDVEMGFPDSDGRLRWKWVNAQPVYDDLGKLIGAVSSFFDITERKQVEDSLRESEQRYSTLFHAKTNGTAHCRVITDEWNRPIDYEILQVNEAYERITGIKRADIEGHRAREVFQVLKILLTITSAITAESPWRAGS